MNIGSENSRYVTFIPPTTNEVIKLRISDHPSNENEWGEKELTGLPNRRYSIVIFSNKSMPNESNKDVKYLPWRSYSAQNIPVYEITFNRFYLIETFSLLKTILETIYNGGSPEKTTNNVSENKQLKSNNSMKQTIRLTESELKNVIKEVVNEVTDYGNNIFGSSHMNDIFRDKSLDDYTNKEYIQLIELRSKVINDILGRQDQTENYKNKRYDVIYLYGTLKDRYDDIVKVKEFYNQNGWDISAKEDIGWSGYNKYPRVELKVLKLNQPSIDKLSESVTKVIYKYLH